MWIAFVLILGTNGVIYSTNSSTPFESQQACIEANHQVEERLMKNAEASKEVFAYKFDCVQVTKETFKKPGLDV